MHADWPVRRNRFTCSKEQNSFHPNSRARDAASPGLRTQPIYLSGTPPVRCIKTRGVLVANSEEGGRSAKGVRCFNCTKKSHLARHCRPKIKKDKKSPSPSPPTDSDFADPACVAESLSTLFFMGESFLARVCDASKTFGDTTSKGDRSK